MAILTTSLDRFAYGAKDSQDVVAPQEEAHHTHRSLKQVEMLRRMGLLEDEEDE